MEFQIEVFAWNKTDKQLLYANKHSTAPLNSSTSASFPCLSHVIEETGKVIASEPGLI